MNLLYIDLFCGAGGTSTGVERARLGGRKCAEAVAIAVDNGEAGNRYRRSRNSTCQPSANRFCN